MVLRRIPNKLLTFEQIGSAENGRARFVGGRAGLFLVTGPTGSGKTTTLAAMINYINENFEQAHHHDGRPDRVPYHPHKKSIVVQREIGTDTPSFAEGLRRALRQDPDVILVGEMRDLVTISSAITAAETGHLVFGTLHTNGAASTINRIVDAFPTDQQEQVRVQLAGNLLAVLSQCLCPRVDTDGMVASYEFMYVTPGIQNLIRENKSFRIDSEIQTGKRFGMQLLDENLWNLFTAGKISAEECIDKSRNAGQMMDKMQKAGYEISDPSIIVPEGEETAAAAPGTKPSAAPASSAAASGSEAERQAQIAANRARMQAAGAGKRAS